MSFTIARRTAHGARRTAEALGKTAFAVIALIGGFCTLTFADKTSAQQLPQTSISHTAKGGGFADFRKQQQARLLAAIDSTLAAKAEDVITENFAAVKKADVQLQTGVGGRSGNLGINFIGAFAETDTRAFGWQLRAYGGQDIDSGANAGLFYRYTDGNVLLGANAFADYEKHKYGEFVRYSFGGEVKSDIVSFAANYYIPLTDNKKVNATLAAFSRQGYDGKLRIAAPRFRQLKAAVDYYHFVGEGDTAKENGFRYGMEWQPTSALRLNLFYDDGGEEFGGDIGYVWNFGEAQKRESNAAFSPDMFAAVSREYSQRIATVATTTAPPVSVRITPLLTITNAMTAAAITTTTRITAAGVPTTITTFPVSLSATRMASVHFTNRIRIQSTNPFDSSEQPVYFLVVTSSVKYLFTLPPASQITRPLVIITMQNLDRGIDDEVYIISRHNVPAFLGNAFPVGSAFNFSNITRLYTLTIAENSEEFISIATTLTTRTTTTTPEVITETPMTMAAVSTTTRITTFSTMFITLTANTAMGDMGDSRFRGNDGGGDNPLYVIALKGRPVHSTGQRPVTALPIYQALKGRPILLQGKARQKPQSQNPARYDIRRRHFRSPFQGLIV